jgi:hypothetical protein
MITSRRLTVVSTSLLAITALAADAVGQAQSAPSTSDLQAQLEALRARVEAQDVEIAQMRQSQGDQWLTERRAEEIRGLVQDVLADSDMRANLLENGIGAGHDGKHFYLASADGNFRLNIGGYIQARYVANSRDDSLSDDTETGFQVRRAKIEMFGHVVSPKFIYSMQFAAHRDSGAVEMDRGYIGYMFTDDVVLHAGRFKAPLLREELNSATRQLAVERSLINAIFTANYVDGVKLDVNAANWLKLSGSINDGLRSGDPGGVGNDFASDTTDFAATVRADAKFAGDWAQMRDFSAWSGEATAAFVGAALHYEIAETGDMQLASPTIDNFLVYTVDGSLEHQGFNAYGAIVGQSVDSVTGTNFDDFAAMLQGGYMIVSDKFELFARYEWISPDGDRALEEMNLITAGFNYYINKHGIKWSTDIVWALDPLNSFAFSSPTSRTGLGLLPDAAGEDGQVVLRTQFQLVF